MKATPKAGARGHQLSVAFSIIAFLVSSPLSPAQLPLPPVVLVHASRHEGNRDHVWESCCTRVFRHLPNLLRFMPSRNKATNLVNFARRQVLRLRGIATRAVILLPVKASRARFVLLPFVIIARSSVFGVNFFEELPAPLPVLPRLLVA